MSDYKFKFKYKKNFIATTFSLLALFVVVVLVVFSQLNYSAVSSTMRQEVINLNSNNLTVTASEISDLIVSGKRISDEIAFSSKVSDYLQIKEAEITPEITTQLSDTVEDIFQRYTWVTSRFTNLVSYEIIGYNNMSIKYPYSQPFNITANELKSLIENSSYSEGKWYIDYNYNPDEQGIFKYTFRITQEIKDPITSESLGILVITISEHVLYNTYHSLITDNKEHIIIDKDNTIISHKNKGLIGSKYSTNTDNPDFIQITQPIPSTHWNIIANIPVQLMEGDIISLGNNLFFMMLVFIVITLITMIWFTQYMKKPIDTIKTSMEQVTMGDFSTRIDYLKADEFGEIANSFNHMVGEIDRLIDSVKTEEKKKRMAELDFLQAQINPHFIYNTLSSIRFLAEMGDTQRVSDMLFSFSKLLRKTLSRSDEYITISQEIDTVVDYATLQSYRYPDSFMVKYHIDPSIENALIPTLLLQPLVENAIFYNVGSEEMVVIEIIGRTHEDNIYFEIIDNGIGMTEEQMDKALNQSINVNSVGLHNIDERIKINYGDNYGISLGETLGKGTKIIVKLPNTQ